MNNTTKTTHRELLQLIQDPNRCASRERESVKAKVLVHYLKRNIDPNPNFEASFIACVGARRTHNDPLVFRDEEGEVALAQPYAEMFVVSEARHFNGALGLILMAEACYGPTVGDPGMLCGLLDKFRPLVMGVRFLSTVMLHEFLEVDKDLGCWLSENLRRYSLVPGRDYLILPPGACGDSRVAGDMSEVHLESLVAAKLAVATPTIRGRKLRACLVEPRVNSFDFADLDPALLELLLTPPARGLDSLKSSHLF